MTPPASRPSDLPAAGSFRDRRPLAGWQGGRITTSGPKPVAERLAAALDTVGEAALGELTHGFHSYPARFPPLLARRLLLDHPEAQVVLDPFVGSGTTLVEAIARGRRGLGVDANPLAVALSHLKATPREPDEISALLAAVRAIAERSLASVRQARKGGGGGATKAPVRWATRYDDPTRYPPHVFPELVGLRQLIDRLGRSLREPLLLVLSSIVVKVSLQRSDTDEQLVERAVARGAASRHFLRRGEELAHRLGRLAAAVPRGTPPPDVRLGDARRLDHLAPASVDLVITSPPYLGTYDYAAHHRRRFGWLGFDPALLEEREIGARRRPSPERYRQDVAAYLGELARVLRPTAFAYLLIGDSTAGAEVVPGDLEIRRAAEGGGTLEVVATAAQGRPETFAPARSILPEGKREHLIALRRR